MTRHLSLALMPGDGIGNEVIPEATKVLDAIAERAGLTVEYQTYDVGSRRYLATGELLPDSMIEELRGSDAILFGAIGDPSVAPGILERGIILQLRFVMDYYLNLRPVKLYPGVRGVLAAKGPAEIDMVVCREGTEGPYAGAGGSLRTGTEHEVVTEVAIHTRHTVERIIRDAFERATRRRNKVTLVAKTNVLVHSGSLWQRTFDAVAADYGQVATDYCHVDAAAMYLLTSPERFDVVVTDNLFGDILTDLGGAVSGGVGLASSANMNPARTGPSMFEPVHGSAPDIVGTGKADPRAAILSAALMLEFLGDHAVADRIRVACAQPVTGSTTEIGSQIAARVAG